MGQDYAEERGLREGRAILARWPCPRDEYPALANASERGGGEGEGLPPRVLHANLFPSFSANGDRVMMLLSRPIGTRSAGFERPQLAFRSLSARKRDKSHRIVLRVAEMFPEIIRDRCMPRDSFSSFLRFVLPVHRRRFRSRGISSRKCRWIFKFYGGVYTGTPRMHNIKSQCTFPVAGTARGDAKCALSPP